MAYIPYYVPEQLQDNISYFAYLMSVEHIKNLHSWRWYFVVLRIIYKHKIRVVAPMYLELSYMVILITYLSLIPTHIFDPRSPFPFLSSVQPVFLLIFFRTPFLKKNCSATYPHGNDQSLLTVLISTLSFNALISL